MKNFEKIEYLKNFPFTNFDQLQESLNKKESQLLVAKGNALNWIISGHKVPKNLRTRTMLSAAVPFVLILALIIYSFVTSNFILLLTLPFSVIAFFLLTPNSPTREYVVNISFVVLLLSSIFEKQWFTILSLLIIVIYYSYEFLYGLSKKYSLEAIKNDEELLCLFWKSDGLTILFINNGNYYSSFCKRENGKDFYYEIEN
ncbi:MAG: hypothetical protein WCS86_00155 [Candidatus Paceibacterota bacterium]